MTTQQKILIGCGMAIALFFLGFYSGCRAGAVTKVLPGGPIIIHDTVHHSLPVDTVRVSKTTMIEGANTVEVDSVVTTKYVAIHDTIPSVPHPFQIPSSLSDLFAKSVPITGATIPAFASSENPQAYLGVTLAHDFLGGTWGGGLDLRAHLVNKFYIIGSAGLYAKQFQVNLGAEYRLLDIYR